MKKMQDIKLVIDVIENNLYDEIDIRTISEMSYISVAQLYRDFYSAVGHSVKEYVRKRRLSNALALVRQSKLSIAEISDRCGYSSTEVFYKAVKKTVHVTPLSYRNGEGFFYFPPKISREHRQIVVTKENIPETFHIEYISHQTKDMEADAVQLFLQCFSSYEGRLYGRNGRQPGHYELYANAEYDHTKLQKPLVHIGNTSSFSGIFATTIVNNSYEDIQATWNYIYYDWLETSMFHHAPAPCFEEYLIKNGVPKKLKIYVPVQKRDHTLSISIEKMEAVQFIGCTMQGEDAETKATNELLCYLINRYPDIVNDAKQIRICKNGNECICGIRLLKPISIDAVDTIQILSYMEGEYAVLQGRCCSDYQFYSDILLSWIHDNGLAVSDGFSFAEYDISGGFDKADMKIYCRLRQHK